MLRPSGLVAILVVFGGTALYMAEQRHGPQTESPFKAHLIGATVDAVSLERIDLSARFSIQSSRKVTVKEIRFQEAAFDGLPMQVEPFQQEWTLNANAVTESPRPLRLRLYLRDVVRAENLAAMLRRGSARFTSSIEVEVATPLAGRLLLMAPTQTVSLDIAMDVPLVAPPRFAGSILEIGAKLAERLRNVVIQAAEIWISGRSPARRNLVQQYSPALESVRLSYTLREPDGVETVRAYETMAFRAEPGVLCTTREALEPWRFKANEAALLQTGGGTLLEGSIKVSLVPADPGRAPVWLDAKTLRRSLPDAKEHKVYAGAGLKPTKLLESEDPSNVVCLRSIGPSVPVVPPQDSVSTQTAAAFRQGASGINLEWTNSAASTGKDRFEFDRQLSRAFLGSPLVSTSDESGSSNSKVIGIVVSPRLAVIGNGFAQAVAHPVSVQVLPQKP